MLNVHGSRDPAETFQVGKSQSQALQTPSGNTHRIKVASWYNTDAIIEWNFGAVLSHAV